ncbi:hypothetical protein ADK75_15755 [Streptomyces virginiae]|uniref:Uncharacterized protein n=1 Tax=Streptomyces virginiae TaxID=1961 RepID=A0A0L8MQH9_STRVG|nr:hypothetical protein [Streptomyces virginiae]KOG52654.1 hypothetical protein ADK75_15755 [Streptomyces virginiae]
MYDDAGCWERWIARLMAVFAADAADQLAWAGEHGVKSVPVTDDADFVLHLAEGMAQRGTLAPQALQDLRAIGRLLDEADVRGRAGLWAESLTAEPAWNEVRPLARRILVAREGDWRRPLPHRVPPQHLYD